MERWFDVISLVFWFMCACILFRIAFHYSEDAALGLVIMTDLLLIIWWLTIRRQNRKGTRWRNET